MLCFLCKSNKNYQFLNCFIFDLITLKNTIMSTYFHNLIIYIARIWPESLCYTESETIQNPILCLIMHTVKKAILTNSKKNSNYLLYVNII